MRTFTAKIDVDSEIPANLAAETTKLLKAEHAASGFNGLRAWMAERFDAANPGLADHKNDVVADGDYRIGQLITVHEFNGDIGWVYDVMTDIEAGTI